MKKRLRGRSIKWRIITIFVIIVFIAMTVAGVFVTGRLESYEINSISSKCHKTLDMVETSLQLDSCTSLEDESENIQPVINEWRTGTDYNLYVVDDSFRIIASNNSSETVGSTAMGVLDESVVVKALKGDEAENHTTIQEKTSDEIPVYNAAKPLTGDGGKVIGVLYVSANLTEVYDTTGETKAIFIQAMIIALFITIFISYFITKGITSPINDLTDKAEKMSVGDFSQEIKVKSNDEIGRLAEMFNILRKELDSNINEISNEKRKLETILKYMADGLIAFDLKGNIIHVNTAAGRLLDMPISEIEKMKINAIISSLGKTRIIKNIKNLGRMRPNEMYSEIVRYGASILSIRYARIKAGRDDDIGMIMLIQDVTEQQKMEQMQTDFVANVSHELRTPLTTIKSYTETLLESGIEDKETQNTFLQVIDDEAERMTRLIKELLQLSKMDSDMEKMQYKTFDMNRLLAECSGKLRLTAAAKNQTIRNMFDKDKEIKLYANRDGIQQVILNILTNSIKYTPEGGEIRIESFVARGNVYARISDNGIGINEKELSRIFERFYRVDKARSRSMGGTGLGLAIAKQIVEMHGGGIRVRSTEGKGTTMTVEIPCTRRGRIN